jgi:ankyrin repeat protein
MLKELELLGAKLNVKNAKGLTPMHIAAWSDLAFPLTFLVEKGLDPDEADEDGQTPLHWACYHGADRAIYYLLAWIKDINA